MATRKPGAEGRTETKGGLLREVAYFSQDEVEALEKRAKKEISSKSSIIRRAVRAYLGIED